MNRRFRQGDTFSKVMPTYHHHKESTYINNQSQTHRTYSEHKTDDLGDDLGNMDLRYFKKKDYMCHYHDLIIGLGPELAPKPRGLLLNKEGQPWRQNLMHSMWPINSIYAGKYQSGAGTGMKI